MIGTRNHRYLLVTLIVCILVSISVPYTSRAEEPVKPNWIESYPNGPIYYEIYATETRIDLYHNLPQAIYVKRYFQGAEYAGFIKVQTMRVSTPGGNIYIAEYAGHIPLIG